MAKHLKEYWSKQNIEKKRDLLRKYYPNPRNQWTVTNQMILDIYDKETSNKPVK